MMCKEYGEAERPGIIAIVLSNEKLLLLKRRNFPFISNPNIWTFVSGGIKRDEDYEHAAYRELFEETGLAKGDLKKIEGPLNVKLFDPRKKICWANKAYIFTTSSNKIKLNIENSAYRWATIKEIETESLYTNIFINKSAIIKKLKSVLYGEHKTKA
ncbi:MAG: NUDIX domain-containing protein [Candidatus Micrarchaeia archaeon]